MHMFKQSNMFLCVVLVLALVAVAPGSAGSGRIADGTKASVDDYPYFVSIIVDGERKCGGAIVNSKQVLTAAACTDGLDADDIKIKVLKDGSMLEASHTTEHDFYGGDPDFDVSLIDLKKETDITPVELMLDAVPPKSECIVLGQKSGGDELQMESVTTMARRICRVETSYDNVKSRMICSTSDDGNNGVCEDDLGGPLICDGKMAAVVATGVSCEDGTPSKYTSLATMPRFFRDYLEN